MSTASFNPRTVLAAMFAARDTEQRFLVNGRASTSSQTNISEGVADSMQGQNVTFDGVGTFPWYLNLTMHNIGEFQRHPNNVSQVFHFNRANMALVANSNYQETQAGGNRGWRIQVNKAALALPDQSYTFNTATPETVLYTSGNSLWQGATPVLYSGQMSEIGNPLSFGTKSTQGGANDKTVMTIKGSSYPNEFRIIYTFYSVAGGVTPINEVAIAVNGSIGQIMGFTSSCAVLTGINAQNQVVRRRDVVFGGKGQYVARS